MRKLVEYFSLKPYRTLGILFGIIVFFYFVMIFIPRTSNLLIASDGIRYYMWVRSLVIDHDLNFANEYSFFTDYSKYFYLDPMVQTSTGYIANKSFIGSGVLWVPFFFIAHIISKFLNYFGVYVNTDGYTYIYQASACIGSIIYGFLGIVLIFQTVKRYFPKSALGTCLIILFGTNVIYYMLFEPLMPHMCSLFAVAMLMNYWLGSRPINKLSKWFTIGLMGGLISIIRLPDITYLLLPIFDGLLDRETTVAQKIKIMGIVSIGFILIFSLQVINWYLIYGTPFPDAYSYSGDYFKWFSSDFFKVLFSNPQGILFLHPILLTGFIGFPLLYQRDRKLTILLILGLIFQIYIIGAYQNWDQGVAYGGRMLIASFPVLAMGIGAFLSWQNSRQIKPYFIAISMILILWNGLNIIQYRLSYIPHFGKFTLGQLFYEKIQMIGIFINRAYYLFFPT